MDVRIKVYVCATTCFDIVVGSIQTPLWVLYSCLSALTHLVERIERKLKCELEQLCVVVSRCFYETKNCESEVFIATVSLVQIDYHTYANGAEFDSHAFHFECILRNVSLRYM